MTENSACSHTDIASTFPPQSRLLHHWKLTPSCSGLSLSARGTPGFCWHDVCLVHPSWGHFTTVPYRSSGGGLNEHSPQRDGAWLVTPVLWTVKSDTEGIADDFTVHRDALHSSNMRPGSEHPFLFSSLPMTLDTVPPTPPDLATHPAAHPVPCCCDFVYV